MKVSELKVGDRLDIFGGQYNIIKFTPDKEPVVKIDAFGYFDKPREFALTARGKKYGYDFFPMTKACDELKNGNFRNEMLSNYHQGLFNPVTITYLKPDGYKKIGLGKETVTLWAYPETKETRSNRWDTYVDECGIRRNGNNMAITPNKYEPFYIYANLKPDLQVERVGDVWKVITPQCELLEPLNSFLGVAP